MKLFGNITIQPHGSGRWQAHASLLDKSLEDLPGVCGSKNTEGPWVGGTGATPEEAVTALKYAIGGIVLAACAADPSGSAGRDG